jgi:hypothetical protein
VKVTNRTVSLISSALVLVLTLIATLAFLPKPSTDAAELLGIPLPGDAGEPRVLVVTQSPFAYTAYVRFEITAADAQTLLADSNFQPPQTSDDPLAQLSQATLGNQSVATIAATSQPDWWSPQPGKPYLLAQRSRVSPSIPYTGPDGAWYILDTTSDPSHVTVYVYLVEV